MYTVRVVVGRSVGGRRGVLLCRVALENLLKYGILVEPLQLFDAFAHDPYHVPNLALFVGVNAYILAAFFIELKLGTHALE